jgi:hypothetical protein
MSRMSVRLAGVVFAVVLAAPWTASAGIIDFIWEMSGPQMGGLPIECDVDFRPREGEQSPGYECRIGEIHVAGERNFRHSELRRLWLSTGGAVYTSTPKDSAIPFRGLKVGMVGYEPMVHFRSLQTRSKKFAIEHGVVGLSHLLIVGKGFKPFDNIGVKFMPLEVRYRWFALAYTMRVFPNGFTAAQFGGPTSTTTDRRSEIVNGFTATILWKPLPY